MPGETEHPTVAVAVLTFRREQRIRALVPELLAQAHTISPEAVVIVIDNDPAGSAREIVLDARGARYVHEPAPGIAAARNRALDEAAPFDLLVFIDDDETPQPGWLRALVGAWRSWRCAAISGPVVSSFERAPDAWVRSTGVFDTKDRPNGAVLTGAASNNLLLDLHQLRALDLRFDERFGLTGGEDTRLIHGLIKAGGTVRWCRDAVVTEFVPAERTTRSWVLRRRLRTSNSWSRVALDMAGSRRERARERAELTARGVARTIRGGVGVAVAVVRRDVPLLARSTVEAVNGTGMVLGAWGHVREEYARPR